LRESASGLERCRFRAPRDGEQITCLAFAADGRRLVAGYHLEPVALVWDVTGRLREGKLLEARPSPARLAPPWQHRGDRDGVKAHRAIWELVAAPKQTVRYLKEHLRTPTAVGPKQVAKWIADLDARQFAVRDAAARALEKLGLDAAPALRRALAQGT